MRIAARFSVAVHVLTLLGEEFAPDPTSEWIASSVGVNPVVVRNVSGMLRRAGLVASSQGKAGTALAKPLADVTLLDVYRAVDADGDLFAIHGNPNPQCPVGANIQEALDGVFLDAQRAMEDRLAATTLETVAQSVRAAAAR